MLRDVLSVELRMTNDALRVTHYGVISILDNSSHLVEYQDWVTATELLIAHHTSDDLKRFVNACCRFLCSNRSGVHKGVVTGGHKPVEGFLRMDESIEARVFGVF